LDAQIKGAEPHHAIDIFAYTELYLIHLNRTCEEVEMELKEPIL